MVIPLPAMPPMGGPPSAYALSRRPWIYFVLFLQSLFCLARAVVFLDIIGAFLMAIMIGVGYCGVKDYSIQLLCYWGMMCLVNGAFDLVKIIDVSVKSEKSFFDSRMPPEYNVVHGIALGIPLVTLLGVPLAWFLYNDFASSVESELPLAGSAYRQGDYGIAANEQSSSTAGRGTTTFTAFEGSGHRLGTN
eukprot:TRINITY_DN47383_c0_g1_i1.p1 TRINITY_DN47383_c0_g1~~TRINITY_DN47383_c0_g1_i1.p1  ORF type:complete len:191 (-),score=34.52 TRINITY_DN47383_c0_g1_i1:59-631(-)